MKLTKLSLCLATLALGVASAASSYTIELTSDTMAGNTHLKAGEYKVVVEGNQAIFKQGRTSTPVSVTAEQNPTKFRYTAVETSNSTLNAIDLGGTNTKLVVAAANGTGSVPAGGGQ